MINTTEFFQIVSLHTGVPVDDLLLERTMDSYGFDSIDRIQLVMALEDEWDVEIPDEALPAINTIQDLLDAAMSGLAERTQH